MQKIQQLSTNFSSVFESLRQRDALISGVQITGLIGIGAAASWFLPYSYPTRIAATLLSTGLAKFYGGADGAVKMFTDHFPKALGLCRSIMKPNPQHKDTGIWLGSGIAVRWSQFFDPRLAGQIAEFLSEKRIDSVWDFGCGQNDYSKLLLAKNIRASGLDGNPDTIQLSEGTAEVQDLSRPFEKEKRDCVISLEVGDKMPEKCADQFLENINKHAKKTIIISWAVKGQKGPNHLNSQNNDYVIEKLEKLGWKIDIPATQRLRASAHPIYYWFQDSLMVFNRKKN